MKCVPDVLGLYARHPEAAVIKVMTEHDSQSVRVLILDEKVVDQGFHEVTLINMADADALYVSVNDLSILRLHWSAFVVSGMARHQQELEQLCHACKKWYRGVQAGLCSFCGRVIRLDMTQHVANYHLELAQLWCCPVSWCTQWKGTPQDCVDHIRLAHTVPATVKAANLGQWFPQWTVSRKRGA